MHSQAYAKAAFFVVHIFIVTGVFAQAQLVVALQVDIGVGKDGGEIADLGCEVHGVILCFLGSYEKFDFFVFVVNGIGKVCSAVKVSEEIPGTGSKANGRSFVAIGALAQDVYDEVCAQVFDHKAAQLRIKGDGAESVGIGIIFFGFELECSADQHTAWLEGKNGTYCHHCDDDQ